MTIFDTRLRRRETVAEGTMAFYFDRPPGFNFEAGQFASFTLVDPPERDDAGDMRTFSLASAPYQGELMIATRMRDTAFKRCLRALPDGAPLEVDGPYGEFTLRADASRPVAMLAGGIGITPFLSMLRHAARTNDGRRRYLFYSNRRPEDAAFLDELRELERADPNLRLIATMAEMEKSSRPWSGETGFIREDLLRKTFDDLAVPLYYAAGPPDMVAAMTQFLTRAGVARAAVIAEEFAGY